MIQFSKTPEKTSEKRLSAEDLISSARIPAIPAALQKILIALRDPNINSDRLEDLILQEPKLSTEILKLVNSSYYSVATPVSSVAQAVVMLGLSTINSLTSGLIIRETFSQSQTVSQKFLKTVWGRSIASAQCIQILSKQEPSVTRDHLFLSAMVHHIGHLVMKQFFEKEYDRCLDETYFPDALLETELFGVDHAIVGALLLKAWNFPTAIIEFVKFHNDGTAETSMKKEYQYLRLANWIADHLVEFQSALHGDPNEQLTLMLRPVQAEMKELNWTPQALVAQSVLFAAITPHAGS